jgi:hypothetical protein
MPGVITDGWLADTRVSYDAVAASYAAEVAAALAGQPYLRAALTLLAAQVRANGGGPVADMTRTRTFLARSCSPAASPSRAGTGRVPRGSAAREA